ncbi:MAG: shikimate kinase [Verrucomicrobiae bacterium]|nr:shikimate kinase [Verrucomicrobiae bacterium]
MASERNIRNIALIGFMGSGKTSVGKLLAEWLKFDFFDTDEFIEARVGKTITRIFAEDGEPVFRQYEREVCEYLKGLSNTVVSTGGGLPANQANLDSLKTHAFVVYLWATPEKLWERVRHQTHRPLLQCPDPQSRIRELLSIREPYYRQADLLVNTDTRSVAEVAQLILREFRSVRAPAPRQQ